METTFYQNKRVDFPITNSLDGKLARASLLWGDRIHKKAADTGFSVCIAVESAIITFMGRWGLYQNSIVLTFAPSAPPFSKLSIKFSERGGECLMETLGKRSLHWNISPLSISGLWKYPFRAISKGPWSPREVVFWPSWSVHRFLTKGNRERLIYISPVGKYITLNSLFFEVTLLVIKRSFIEILTDCRKHCS